MRGGGVITPQKLNEWRLIPRVLMALYGYICWATWVWFTGLGAEATTQQVTFASMIWAQSPAWFGLYVKNGGKGE